MPYDASATVSAPSQHRRGPLRPNRLTSARSHVGGDTLTRLVQLTDLAVLIGLFASGWLRGETATVTGLLAACSALTVATLVSFDAYHLGARERVHRHIYRVIGAVGASGLMLLTFAHLIAPAARAANVLHIVDWCLAAAAMLAASHATWFAYIHRLRRHGLLTPNLMIVGATPSAQRLITAALASRDVNILGVFDDRGGARRPEHVSGVPVLGKTSAIKSHRLLPYVDRIVVAVPPGATARIAQLIAELASVPNGVSLLVENDAASEQAARDRLLDMPLAHLAGARRGVTRAILKRAMDLTLSVAAVVALIPLLITIAIAIRLDSPGPVLFKQRRHGYLNEEVLVWKFRSMRVETSDYSASRQVSAGDDRVTRVGRFIRKTSLDELPQLWNVIRGEMSLVGPRPHAIGMLTGGDEASKLVETYAHRHRMKPGLTGWAAVNGSRGPVDTAEAVRRRVSLDLEYVERQSLWLDISIIAR
ncbi:MAG: hypothetical protein JWQ29_992, partial [Phenylobacterium sp.]|nr:hypothetical protein [Phenylobacterium sp.]